MMKPALDLVSPRCRLFHDYWWQLRDMAEGPLPSKSDFDPAAMTAALPNIVLHDMSTPGKPIMRLVGTAITSRMGFDATGRCYLDFVEEDRKASALAALESMARVPCGMKVLIESRFGSGETTVAESLGYPLATPEDAPPTLMFVDDLVAPAKFYNQREHPMERFGVLERTYVDIGFGTGTDAL